MSNASPLNPIYEPQSSSYSLKSMKNARFFTEDEQIQKDNILKKNILKLSVKALRAESAPLTSQRSNSRHHSAFPDRVSCSRRSYSLSSKKMENFRLLHRLKGSITAAEYSHNGAMLWVGNSTGVVDIRSGTSLELLHSISPIGSSSNGSVTVMFSSVTHMWIGYASGYVLIADHLLLAVVTEGRFQYAAISSVASLSDGSTCTASYDGSILRWNSEENGFEAMRRYKASIDSHSKEITSLASHEMKLFFGDTNGNIGCRVFDNTIYSDEVYWIQTEGQTISALAVVNATLFSAEISGTIKIWEISSGELWKQVRMPSIVRSFVPLPGVKRLWVAYESGLVEVWLTDPLDNFTIERSIRDFVGQTLVSFKALCAVELNKFLTFSSDGENRVWYHTTNHVEESLVKTIEALRSVIERDLKEVEQCDALDISSSRDEISAFSTNRLEKDQVDIIECQRLYFMKWMLFSKSRISKMISEQLALKMSSDHTLFLSWRYLLKWFHFYHEKWVEHRKIHVANIISKDAKMIQEKVLCGKVHYLKEHLYYLFNIKLSQLSDFLASIQANNASCSTFPSWQSLQFTRGLYILGSPSSEDSRKPTLRPQLFEESNDYMVETELKQKDDDELNSDTDKIADRKLQTSPTISNSSKVRLLQAFHSQLISRQVIVKWIHFAIQKCRHNESLRLAEKMGLQYSRNIMSEVLTAWSQYYIDQQKDKTSKLLLDEVNNLQENFKPTINSPSQSGNYSYMGSTTLQDITEHLSTKVIVPDAVSPYDEHSESGSTGPLPAFIECVQTIDSRIVNYFFDFQLLTEVDKAMTAVTSNSLDSFLSYAERVKHLIIEYWNIRKVCANEIRKVTVKGREILPTSVIVSGDLGTTTSKNIHGKKNVREKETIDKRLTDSIKRLSTAFSYIPFSDHNKISPTVQVLLGKDFRLTDIVNQLVRNSQ